MNFWSIFKPTAFAVVLAGSATGCWTFGKSEYPACEVTRANNSTNVTIAVTGFDAVVTEYETIYGTAAVYVPGHYGYRHYHPGFYDIQTTSYLMPQHRATDMFRARASESFEDAGYVLAGVGIAADYSIDVRFEALEREAGDAAAELGWILGTLFFCDYESAEWSAKVRLRDNHTGKIVFRHVYRQRYEAKSVGLLPLFCASANHELSLGYSQGWCLTALTDRVVADVTAFLYETIGGE